MKSSTDRRTILRLMGAALATGHLSMMLPVRSEARTFAGLPGSLSLLPLQDGLFRRARRRMQAHPRNRRLYQEALTYLRASDSARARERFEHHARLDFVGGRVTVIDGWLVSETELALLALVRHSRPG